MATKMRPLQRNYWKAVFGGLYLPTSPKESIVKDYLRDIFIPTERIQVRAESRIVGNEAGLNGFDMLLKRSKENSEELSKLKNENKGMQGRLSKLEKEHKGTQEELSQMRSVKDLINAYQLCNFLPRDKRPSNDARNQLVHGADVISNLRFLRSLSSKNAAFLRDHKLEPSDLEKAFEERYGLHPTVFPEGVTIPEEVEKPINRKSDLVHFLSRGKGIDPQQRKEEIAECDGIIERWIEQLKDSAAGSEEAPQSNA